MDISDPARLAPLLLGLKYGCSSIYLRGRRHEPNRDPGLSTILAEACVCAV
jgi:hypothetical protein